ncbi:hypothetical protein CLNEO_05330 [Anaerotignum neopropionicum]|uniref:Uncharacterized protein n=1 Tax=Anaerotignum neopropionicum TaxID=36847 RepID=A0A136WIX5_9FIRM|nr:hypothetical protein [Anaerotignum neopropionicum]KXL54427.1 hypothetical protein CLNEO_05330 [Anaerotignum neopropionicum]
MRKKKRTFSKQAVKWILIAALFDLQLSYLLAFLGREQIAETLSITVVTSLIGVMLGYFMKSFKETREEEKVRLLEEKRQQEDKQAFMSDLKGDNNNDVAG